MRLITALILAVFLLGTDVCAQSTTEFLHRSKEQLLKKNYEAAEQLADSARRKLEGNRKYDSLIVVYRWLSRIHIKEQRPDVADSDWSHARRAMDSILARRLRASQDDWKLLWLEEQEKRMIDQRIHSEEIDQLRKDTASSWQNSFYVLIGTMMLGIIVIGYLLMNRARLKAALAAEEEKVNNLNAFRQKLHGVLSGDLVQSLSSLENLSRSLSTHIERVQPEEASELLRQFQQTANNTRISIAGLIQWTGLHAPLTPTGTVALKALTVVEEVLSDHQADREAKRIVIQVFIPDNQIITADPEALKSVLNCLIDNAIRYNSEGGTVTCFSGEKDGLVLIGIRDTGSGIAADQLERMLQGNAHNSRGSLGIGLLLARDLVERNGGRIYAESEPGTGSTFYFTWPGKKNE
jgi:signal transduction histidine kinase